MCVRIIKTCSLLIVFFSFSLKVSGVNLVTEKEKKLFRQLLHLDQQEDLPKNLVCQVSKKWVFFGRKSLAKLIQYVTLPLTMISFALFITSFYVLPYLFPGDRSMEHLNSLDGLTILLSFGNGLLLLFFYWLFSAHFTKPIWIKVSYKKKELFFFLADDTLYCHYPLATAKEKEILEELITLLWKRYRQQVALLKGSNKLLLDPLPLPISESQLLYQTTLAVRLS